MLIARFSPTFPVVSNPHAFYACGNGVALSSNHREERYPPVWRAQANEAEDRFTSLRLTWQAVADDDASRDAVSDRPFTARIREICRPIEFAAEAGYSRPNLGSSQHNAKPTAPERRLLMTSTLHSLARQFGRREKNLWPRAYNLTRRIGWLGREAWAPEKGSV